MTGGVYLLRDGLGKPVAAVDGEDDIRFLANNLPKGWTLHYWEVRSESYVVGWMCGQGLLRKDGAK